MNPKFKTFSRINNFFLQTLDHQINQQIIDETSVHCKHTAHVMQTCVKGSETSSFCDWMFWLKKRIRQLQKKNSLLSNKAHAAVLKLQTLHYASQTGLLFFGLFSAWFANFKTFFKNSRLSTNPVKIKNKNWVIRVQHHTYLRNRRNHVTDWLFPIGIYHCEALTKITKYLTEMDNFKT